MSAAGHALTLAELPGSVTVQGDRTRLRQMLVNLIENAIKYTDAPGQITVTLSATAAAWQLQVEDSAPGVDDNDLPQLFDPLFRTSASRLRPGAGLGLAISQRIARAHGGELRADHSPLGGLRITLTLPRQGDAQ